MKFKTHYGFTIELSENLPIWTNAEGTIPLSFFARWINPILHPVTVNFEPWIKERRVMFYHRALYFMGTTIITHPANFKYAREWLREHYGANSEQNQEVTNPNKKSE